MLQSENDIDEAIKELINALKEKITAELRVLPDKPEETPESTLRALWHTAAGDPKSAELAISSKLPHINEEILSKLSSLVDQRLRGVPLAHLTGRQNFMGIEMIAGPEALVPRKETELLGRTAVKIALELSSRQKDVTILDICSGSGNLALAVAMNVPGAKMFGSDISADAINLARRNAKHLGLAQKVEFRVGDLLAPFDEPEFQGQVDILICNPPYIQSAKVKQMHSEISSHEPILAFDGGAFGISIAMRLIKDAQKFLRKGGWLAFEVGLGQGPMFVKHLEKNQYFSHISTINDESDAIRVLAVQY